MKFGIKIPDIRGIIPFGFGTFSLGAAVMSVISKMNLVHLSVFLPANFMTEAHQKWYCVTQPSYASDAILFVLGLLAVIIWFREVSLDETDDSRRKV